MAVQFIIDSSSDILPQECEKLGIAQVLPLKVIFGSEEYTDGVTMSHEDFYKKLVSSDIHPSTSQVPPADFEDAYEKVTANGDTAVVITLSSKLSGTYQSAMIAAEDYEGKVFVVGSENAALGERCLMMRGLQLREAGLSAAEIAAKLDEEKKDIVLLASVDTLTYLQKGGRVSKAAAVAGGLLGIKPVLQMDGEGHLIKVATARGRKKAIEALADKYGELSYEEKNTPIFISHADCQEDAQKLVDMLKQRHGGEVTLLTEIGPVIGSHAGPDVLALFFLGKHR